MVSLIEGRYREVPPPITERGDLDVTLIGYSVRSSSNILLRYSIPFERAFRQD